MTAYAPCYGKNLPRDEFEAMPKPMIFLLPDAWLPSDLYNGYLSLVQERGYTAATIRYPSLNARNPKKADVAADAATARKALISHMDKGNEIVLAMHGYGGMPGNAAAKGLSIGERKATGKSGGIIGLLMIGAIIAREGQSYAEVQGGSLPSWIVLSKTKNGCNKPDDPMRLFAHGFPVPDDFLDGIEPHATLALTSPQPAPAWEDDAYEGRLAYHITTVCLSVPRYSQITMIRKSGKHWMRNNIRGCSLSPFYCAGLKEAMLQLDDFVRAFFLVDRGEKFQGLEPYKPTWWINGI